MQKLQIADNFTFPIEAVTQTFAILAKRGVGKTYTGSVMAEEMLQAQQQIIAIDPTGAWWGLRTKFPIVIFGGEHADIPIEETDGEVTAKAIVENRLSCVIDLSLFRKSQVQRFITAFLETLYRLNREAVHVFVDEADDLCPQKPFGDEVKMVGAMEDLVKRGRRRGIGVTLITQRPADLAKQVLTQVEVLGCLQMTHPRDIKAIQEWVNVHADPKQAEVMIGSIPSLPIGTAWFWSPGWLHVFKKVQVRKRLTFDSSATPKVGERTIEPKTLAPVDLEKLGAQIAATRERAKDNDPKELRRKIKELQQGKAKLEQQIEKSKREIPAPVTISVPIFDDEARKAMTKITEQFEMVNRNFRIITEFVKFYDVPRSAEKLHAQNTQNNVISVGNRPTVQVSMEKVKVAQPTDGDVVLYKMDRAILNALAQFPEGCTQRKIGILTTYSSKSGSFSTSVSKLRTNGYITGSNPLKITALGEDALGEIVLLPTGSALYDFWINHKRIYRMEREILRVLYESRAPLAQSVLASFTQNEEGNPYSSSSGSWSTAVSKLRGLELITGSRELELAEELRG